MNIRVRCNIVILGIFLIGSPFLSGCFPEGTKGCPEEMFVSFYLDDRHDEDGDFDTRIANDVFLSVFKDNRLFQLFEIPYEEIRAGTPFIIDKTGGIEGNLELVAWAVSRNVDGNYVPEWTGADTPGQMTIGLSPAVKSEGKYAPVTTSHYMGLLSSTEAIDEVTIHEIGMNVTPCRIEVHVTDLSDIFNSAGNVHIEVNGTMSRMTMEKKGTGSPAVIVAALSRKAGSETGWTTGRFGVFPSGENQTVSVDIFSDGSLVKTLDVPRENLPRGATSGDLLIFEYTLGQAHYFLTVDGFTQKIVNVDSI